MKTRDTTQSRLSKSVRKVIGIKWAAIGLLTLWFIVVGAFHVFVLNEPYLSEAIGWGLVLVGAIGLIELIFQFNTGRNRQLNEELEKAERNALRQAALVLLSSDLTATLKEDEICQKAVTDLHDVLGYDYLGLYLIEPDSGDRVLQAHIGWQELAGIERIPPGEGVSWQAMVQGQIHYTPDVTKTPEYLPGLNSGAEVDIPIQSEGEILGLLIVESKTPNEFIEEDFNVLATAAGIIALALSKARLFQEVQELAITDPLTGLLNRRQFFSMGEREFLRAKRYEHPLAVILFDIDHFKRVNDRYGHAVGDEVLKAMAARWRGDIREFDVLARYGGEEFVILLPMTDLSSALLIAERLRSGSIKTPVVTGKGSIYLTISLGVTELNPEMPDFSSLVNKADAAMYVAKQAGRNLVRSG